MSLKSVISLTSIAHLSELNHAFFFAEIKELGAELTGSSMSELEIAFHAASTAFPARIADFQHTSVAPLRWSVKSALFQPIGELLFPSLAP